VQSTSGYFLPVIITLFSTLAFAVILVVIFGAIIRRRKELIKKQRQKNNKHENEYKFDNGFEKYDDIIYENEENSYEMVNYYEINENESKIESNTSKTVEYLEIFE
jgi:flagellar biosynthesis/type III secretory pathway M-ring protein FliF/YscJ